MTATSSLAVGSPLPLYLSHITSRISVTPSQTLWQLPMVQRASPNSSHQGWDPAWRDLTGPPSGSLPTLPHPGHAGPLTVCDCLRGPSRAPGAGELLLSSPTGRFSHLLPIPYDPSVAILGSCPPPWLVHGSPTLPCPGPTLYWAGLSQVSLRPRQGLPGAVTAPVTLSELLWAQHRIWYVFVE